MLTRWPMSTTWASSTGISSRAISSWCRPGPGEPLRAKVTDFGIARIADATRLTVTGAMVGTAAYLSPEQAMGSPLSPATDVYSLGLVLLECIKQTMEYPGSAVESAVARLHRAPNIPADLPAEWADLIRSMTAIEPLERPTAADVETALRQALVSPASTPGELRTGNHSRAAGHARPGPPPPQQIPRPPSSPQAQPPKIPTPGSQRHGFRHHAAQSRPVPGHDQTSDRPGNAAGCRNHPVRDTRGGSWGVAILVVLALGGGAAALTASLAPPSTSVVVPYPTVTGTLGDHLQELQKSVEP